MFIIEARTLIEAPISVVWNVLMDMGNYQEWSTLLSTDETTLPRLNATIRLRLSMLDGPSYAFEPEVIVLEENRHFAWQQKTGVRGVFDGEHHFELTETNENQTELHNYERYSGLLSPIIKRLPMMQSAPQGFATMNAEIKHQSERIYKIKAE
jgi:hypothetical protein